MLDAGVDVLSTVNVQHLESLNDSVHELTGVRVQETFPDRVLAGADELVLIDLTPEALIGRLREGKVYPAERVQAALGNFFKIENLATLREIALRQVAEDVEAKRMVRAAATARDRARTSREGPQPVAERILVLRPPAARGRPAPAPGVALGPAAGRGARRALRGRARAAALRRRARAARGPAAAVVGARGRAAARRRATTWRRPPPGWSASATRPTS